MIAHIIPFTRLPRQCTFFDYLIPDELEVTLGDLVLISFRGISLQGIVCNVVPESSHKKLSALKSVIKKQVLSEKDLERFFTLAKILGQSPSTLLHATLPKHIGKKYTPYTFPEAPQSLSPSLSLEELPTLQELITAIKTHPHIALQGDNETGIALAHILSTHISSSTQLLILVPRDRDADILRSFIKQATHAIVTGTTPEIDRAAIFHAWREGTVRILIGTKQVALWSAPLLTHILVLQAGNDEYGNHRRNPKYDPREAARQLAIQHHAHYISIDTLPRIEDCTEQWHAPYFAPDPQSLTPYASFISLADRTEKTTFPLITQSLEEGIKKASQSKKRVLLFLNRKGAAKRLQCAACDFVPLCGTCGNIPTVRATEDLLCDRCQSEMWIPKTCPQCQKPRLKFVGVGGEKVAVDLKKRFPDLSIGFVEKGNDASWKTADIVIATEHIFANLITPFTRYHFGLIADLMADLPVGGVNFRATEQTARQLLRLLFFAKREKAACLIQTWIPTRLPDLIAPTFVITEELRIRKEYKLPPFGTLLRTKTTTLRNPLIPPQEPYTYDGTYHFTSTERF